MNALIIDTGRKVRRVNAVLQHPAHRFMLANLDREVRCPDEGWGILEIKTASYHSAPQWEEGIALFVWPLVAGQWPAAFYRIRR
ncbi:YqaJ viral recombinase family protein [Aquitalea pelogenes]|uniref:YqaJ viral recombinase family protein n=1 Tax=Aquitalea pelogenes TaxID=1293573 RepID=UPI0035B13B03